MKIIHFADLHLGVENYGRLNPETGLHTRLEDFLAAFDQLVDFALKERVDLVLFCGDAYKSREPSQTQQREMAKRVSRLAKNGIPVFLLVGNHDLHNAAGRATAVEIFDTLAIPNVFVSNRPDVYVVQTPSGAIQVATLPWLRRAALLSRDETRDMNFEQINEKAQQVLTDYVASHASRLDPALPAVLAGHVWISGATPGSEKQMTIGQEHVLLPGNVANPAFDYVALGHIHKRQVLWTDPPVVYSGSLERVDFSEEDDDKGFYLVEIEPDGQSTRKQVSFQFHPVPGRPFLTIEVNVEAGDLDPTATVLKAIGEQCDRVKDAIVRLIIEMPSEIEGHLADGEIRNALKEAHYVTIAKDVKRESRLRLGRSGQGGIEEITPLEALKAYLDNKNAAAERAALLLKYGQELISQQDSGAGERVVG
ncbi:MAG: exonuclease SbcCD subunit D [Chloroflexi bacterium]|nr:exonuclease SbcCD subunit D [Chloroflexota bacterium]